MKSDSVTLVAGVLQVDGEAVERSVLAADFAPAPATLISSISSVIFPSALFHAPYQLASLLSCNSLWKESLKHMKIFKGQPRVGGDG